MDEGMTGAERAALIRATGTGLDYEHEAIESIARSWEHDDNGCAALALQDAQAFALLHLARVLSRAVETR